MKSKRLFFLLTVITTKRKDVMTKSIDNERWLSDGNCKLCRRSKYCSKACKANKEATQRDIYSAVNKAIGGIFAHMLEKQASLFR
jgi:radical SAM protein with 4Fe4S-binding SPASM domain